MLYKKFTWRIYALSERLLAPSRTDRLGGNSWQRLRLLRHAPEEEELIIVVLSPDTAMTLNKRKQEACSSSANRTKPL